MNSLLTMWAATVIRLAGLVTDRRGQVSGDRGASIPEYMGIVVMGIVVVVAVIPLMQALGVDVVNWVRVQLGI